MLKRKQAKLSSFLSPEGQKDKGSVVKLEHFKDEWTAQVVKDDFPSKGRVLPTTVARPAVGSGYDGYTKTASSFRPPDRAQGEPKRSFSSAEDNSASKSKSKTTAPAMDDVTLSTSQKKVLDTIMARKSVFFTGAAGTGKSYILKVLREVLDGLGLSDKVSFTAPTGVAACNIRGLTIHAWAGVGVAAEPMDQLAAMVSRSRVAAQRWKECEILVIDEISMLSAELFDKLSFIGTRVRNDPRPFGGLQLILCGDFFQLPPIGVGKSTHFCFESKNWELLFGGREDGMIVLDKVFRQQNDSVFLNILNDLRMGVVTPQAQKVLGGKVQQSYLKDREAAQAAQSGGAESSTVATSDVKLEGGGGTTSKAARGSVKAAAVAVRPTKLFSTNKDVDSYNATELAKLAAADEVGDMQRYEAIDEGKDPFLNQLRQGTKAPAVLELRIGAQVMLLKNISTARGLVNGARGTVVGFEKSNNRTANVPYIPLVKFQLYVGAHMTEETISLDQETWDIKQGERVLASRVQIPLMLAWAISIHKSQGMTIPLLEVSFNNVFEYGQGYVALSRATCLEGLTLRSFQVSSIKAHNKVAEFYERISSTAATAATATPAGSGGGTCIAATTVAGSSSSASADVPAIITTKVSTFAKAFLKDVPVEDNSAAWMESRNTKVASFKSVVSTYKQNVSKSRDADDVEIDYSRYGIVQDDDIMERVTEEEVVCEEAGNNEDEEQEQQMYINQASARMVSTTHSTATQTMSNLLHKTEVENSGASKSGGVVGNKFSQFSLPDNEWLDEEPSAAQREKSRQAYLKQATQRTGAGVVSHQSSGAIGTAEFKPTTATETATATATAAAGVTVTHIDCTEEELFKSPETVPIEDESTTDGFYEIDSEVSNLSYRAPFAVSVAATTATALVGSVLPQAGVFRALANATVTAAPVPQRSSSTSTNVVIDLMDDSEDSHSVWGLPAPTAAPVRAHTTQNVNPNVATQPPASKPAPAPLPVPMYVPSSSQAARAAVTTGYAHSMFAVQPRQQSSGNATSNASAGGAANKLGPHTGTSLLQLISAGTSTAATKVLPVTSSYGASTAVSGGGCGAAHATAVLPSPAVPMPLIPVTTTAAEHGANTLSEEQRRRIEQNKVMAQQRLAEFRARSAAEARKVMEDCKLMAFRASVSKLGVAARCQCPAPVPQRSSSTSTNVVIDLMDDSEDSHSMWGLPAPTAAPLRAHTTQNVNPNVATQPPASKPAPAPLPVPMYVPSSSQAASAAVTTGYAHSMFAVQPRQQSSCGNTASNASMGSAAANKLGPHTGTSLLQLISAGTSTAAAKVLPVTSSYGASTAVSGGGCGAAHATAVLPSPAVPVVPVTTTAAEHGADTLSEEQRRRIEQNKVMAQQRLAEFRARSAAEARKVMEECKL